MGLKNTAVLREVLRSFVTTCYWGIGKKVKSNLGQYCNATGWAGRTIDFCHGTGISTVLGLFGNLEAQEPLLVANKIQIYLYANPQLHSLVSQ